MQFSHLIGGVLAMLAVPLILLMYLWKQKYQQRQVPSLFLWEKVLLQTKSQQPWQKLRKNLLMFLQIAAAVLLAFALAGPYIVGKTQVRDYVLALDCSLSMQATDVVDSRFQAAVADMEALVQNAVPGASFSLVMLTDAPYLAASGTGEKETILRLLQQAKPTAGSVDWADAKSLLEAEQETLGGEVVLYTDGYGNLGNFSATEQVYCGNGENTAITLLSHTEQQDGRYVLSRLHHYGTAAAEKSVTLYVDGVAYDMQNIMVQPGMDSDVVFRGVPLDAKELEVRLSPEDALAADDARFAGIGLAQQRRVLLVSEGNLFLEKALSLLDGVALYRMEPTEAEALQGYDLYVFDGVLPQDLPTDGYLLLLNPPTGNAVVQTEETRAFTDPVRGVTGSGLENTEEVSFVLQKGHPLSAAWGSAFLQSEGETLGLYGQWQGRKTAVLGFDLHDSDFPLQTEFPIVWYRLLEWYFPEEAAGISQAMSGDAVTVALQPATQMAQVTMPDGKEIAIAPPFPAKTLTETTTTGIYVLTETDADGTISRTPFGVNAKTEPESDLSLYGEQTETETGETKTILAGRSIRVWILLLLLAFVLAEWRVNCREH